MIFHLLPAAAAAGRATTRHSEATDSPAAAYVLDCNSELMAKEGLTNSARLENIHQSGQAAAESGSALLSNPGQLRGVEKCLKLLRILVHSKFSFVDARQR